MMATTTQSPGRHLFIGNLPFSVGWQDLKDLFREAGTVVRADVASTPQGRSRGFGTVVFATPEEALNAINTFNNYEWSGRKLEVREDRAVSSSANNGNGHAGAAPAAGPALSTTPAPPEAVGDGSNDAASLVNSRGLYVGNLPYSIGWQDLKDLFRSAGNVQRADIPMDYQGRSKGFGTVLMSSVEEARKAVSMFNLYDWNGRRIEVREDRTYVEGAPVPEQSRVVNGPPAPQHNSNIATAVSTGAVPAGGAGVGGRALFVGNLPFTVQWQELKDLFRQAGNVQRADVAQDNQGRSRGYGSVLMSTVEEAEKAIQILNGNDLQGRVIEVREDKFAGDGGSPVPGTVVFVGNLPYSTRWQDLKDLFRPYGLSPVHADIMAEAGRSKGCGTVRFATKEESERAVKELNGVNVQGRNVVVRLDKFT